MAKEEIRDAKRNKIGYMDRKLNGECVIYDKRSNKIGTIKPQGDRLIAYDKRNIKLGYWDESSNTTFDAKGKRLGKENLLMGFYEFT
ncbi:MAG: hypothetical protein LBK57_02750 [Clostridiales Family XIII bacterium]|jgi:hypothetical protein|nr:hypothetical protein [Clostridiales Family XIII bacterium]